MKSFVIPVRLCIVLAIFLSTLSVKTQTPAASSKPASAPAPTNTASAQREILDQYCVTCHNDRAKTANLSLEKLDLTTAGDHPELWEKVIRKLRAGVMPPPGIRRPP